MADGDKRHGKEPSAAAEAPAEDKFPEGMRVLAVDDDPVCRRILGALLGICKYNATVVSDAVTALEMLRDGGGEQFDLVITDVHMPDMDGFELLELIGLEMDLPVIMLSVNGEKETVLKGITHGACDYLVKPVHVKELKNIWQHVIRKNPGLVNHSSSDSDELDEGEENGAKRKKYYKKKKRDGNDSDDDKESTRVQTTRKKPRVSWTGPLHNRFIDVVNHLGVDKAVLKTILQMMDVRLPDQRVCRKPSSGIFDIMHAPHFYHFLNNATPCKPYAGVLCEKMLEAGIVDRSSNPGNSSLAEMPNGGMLGPVNQFPVQPPELVSEFFGMVNMEPSAASTRREAQFPRLVGSSSNPWQHVASSSFPVHMDGAPLAQSQVNFPQIDQLQGFEASPRQMSMFHNEQQNEIAGIINNNATSVVAFSEQMTSLYDMSSNTAPVEMSNDSFSPMALMVNGGSTSSALRNLQTGSSVAPPTQMANGGSISPALPDLPDSPVAPTQMLNPWDASGIIPVQEGPADEQALDDQPNYTSSYFPEDIFTSMLNQDFNDDAIFGGGF
ncbi:unnamed protein product [Alopecurus aequalis]